MQVCPILEHGYHHEKVRAMASEPLRFGLPGTASIDKMSSGRAVHVVQGTSHRAVPDHGPMIGHGSAPPSSSSHPSLPQFHHSVPDDAASRHFSRKR